MNWNPAHPTPMSVESVTVTQSLSLRSPPEQPVPCVAVLVISDLEFGGAQRQVIELANHMDSPLCRTYVCSLSSFVPLAASLRDRESRLKMVPRRFRFDFTVVLRLARLLRQLQADVVYSYLFDATIAARLAGRLVRRPAVIGSERNTNYTLKRSDYLAFKMTNGCPDLIIANSRAGAIFNSHLYGNPLSRYRVVHNGVDTERFRPEVSAPLRAELGLKAEQPVVGMFASLKPQKNHPLWLRAARRVLEQVPDVMFLFVGDELYKGMSDSVSFKATVQGLVDELGLRRHCLFVGNRLDVARYYPLCAVTVLPSLFEGTPNAALESMACGVPVVATDVSDNSYIVPNARAGYIVPLGEEEALADRVCALLKDGVLRKKLSKEARAWALEEFSCSRLASKTEAVYREAIGLRHARRHMRLAEKAGQPGAGPQQ